MARTTDRESRHLASINQAANYAGVCTKTIRRMISRGELTGYRLGPRLVRIDLRELDTTLRVIPSAGGGGHAA
jgi:excisionase family DNA binding protein